MSVEATNAPFDADSCVKCGLCLPHCPTHRLTGDEMYSPRGRLLAISQVAGGETEIDAAFDDALSTCLGCRACEAVCPGLVPYGPIFEQAMADLRMQRPTAARRVRGVLLGRIIAWPGAARLAGSGARLLRRLHLTWTLPAAVRSGLAGMRPEPSPHGSWVGRSVDPTEDPRATVALLSGCVMDAWFAPVHDATVGLLQLAGYRVVVPPGQTCCGALAAHDGHAKEARRMAATNTAAFARADLIVSDAAGCSAHLKEYDHWAPAAEDLPAKVRDITELVASLIAEGALPTLAEKRGEIAIQDPCHLRHAQRITTEPRAIVRAAGYEPVEIDADGMCCGAAGVYMVLHPETSSELGTRKAQQVETVGAALVASANPGCEMQLRAHLPARTRVAHPIEFYWEALQDEHPDLVSNVGRVSRS